MGPPPFARCVSLLLLAVPASSVGQEVPGGSKWGVELGITSLQLREEVLNPLRHRGTLASLGVFRDGSGPTVSGRFALEAAFNPVATRYESDKNSFVASLRLGYRRLYRVRELTEDLELHVGGTGEFYTHTAYFGDWDDSHGYWLTAYSIGASAALRLVRWRANTISLEASVPVLAMVSRPDAPILNKVDDNTLGAIVAKVHENMVPTSLNEHVAVDVTLRYIRPSSRLARSVFWRIFWLHNDMDGSEPVAAMRHSLGVSAVF
jgi:hypothetical protein